MRVSVGTVSSVSGTAGTGAAGRVAYWQDATTLTSSASFLFNGTSLQVPDGAAATPSYGFANDPDNGMYLSGTNAIGLVTAGVSRVAINATGGVGIEAGTGTDTMFRVRGNSNTSGSDQFGQIIDTIFSSSATSGAYSLNVKVATAASAFTCGFGAAITVAAASKGAGSTISRLVSLNLQEQTAGNNNAAIADNASFTGNWFINSTSTRQSLFSGSVQITTDGNLPLALTGNSSAGTVRFINPAASTKYNWLIGGQFNINNTFEITPSTAVDGSTFSAPVFQCEASTGLITVGPAGATPIHRFNTATAATAGAEGDFLRLNVNGTNFKIQLYADS